MVGSGYTFIDLFAGAGGLSEGFISCGFNPIAHVEMNNYAARTLETRSAFYYLKKLDRLDLYYDYLSGNIERDGFISQIPKHIVQTVMCQTMSDKTLPKIFKTIDGILKLRNIRNENIDGLLMERHIAKVARRSAKYHLKGPAKRTDEDDRRFEESFRQLIENCESEYRKDATKP